MKVTLVIGALACALDSRAALVGFYPFDESSPLADASGSGRDLVSVGDPTYQPAGGLEGGAFFFNGQQRFTAPIDINPATLPNVTMGAWVKTSTLALGLRKIIGTDNGGWDRTIGLDDRNGPFRYTSFIGNGDPAIGAPGPRSTNQWTFIAASYDGPANQLALYVDLDAVSTEPFAVVNVATGFGPGFDTVSIGSVRPDSAGEGWQGAIDNVFFYDEALNAEQITAIRNGGRAAILGLPASDPDLVVTTAPALDNLAKVPSVKTLSFGIKNAGATRSLTISGVTITGPDAAYYSVPALPGTLAAGASGTLDVRFDSRGQVGTFSATANIASGDPGTPSLALDLTASVSAVQSLLGLYSFDDAAAPLKDDSGAGRTLVDGFAAGAANPTYLPAGGVSGGAFEFGGSQWLAAPLDINASVQPRLTMGAWVKTASLDPAIRKVMGHDNGAWDRVIGLDTRAEPGGGPMPAGTFRYVAFTGTDNHGPTQGDPPPTPLDVDAWTFLAANYDQTTTSVSLYVDLDASTTDDALQVITDAAPMGPGLATVGIGAISPTGGEGWLGAIDNVFFIGGAMDSDTMRAIRDGGKQTLLSLGPDPVLAVLTALPVFGRLPNASPKTVQIQIRNGGASQTLQISSAKVTGPDAGLYSLGALPASLAPGATASISVTLTPGTREGATVAALELVSNDSAGRSRTIDLSAGIPFSSVRASLLGFYPFDDPADPLKDESGNGLNLTSAGADPQHVPDGGVEGGAFLFNGTQRLVAPVNINPTERPVLTMGAWVRVDSLAPALRKVIGSDNGGWDRTIGLDDRGDNPFRYTTFVGNGPPLPGTPEPVSTEHWTFLAVSFDQPASQLTVYVDLDSATTDDPLVAVVGNGCIFGDGFNTSSIGSVRPESNGEGWLGSIDNTFFYGSVLSQADLTTIRNEGKAAILRQSIRIISVSKTPSSLSLTWSSGEGLTYAVEYSERITGPFSGIGTVPSQGVSTSFTDNSATRLARPTGFYRVTLP